MKTIVLRGEKELRIYSLPLRQRILREMHSLGRPVTSKEIADRLSITPSSAQHHLKKLMSIGLVEFDHTEEIHGIQARYLHLADANVSIGQQYADALAPVRDETARAGLMAVFDGYMSVVKRGREEAVSEDLKVLNDIVTGIVHLSLKEADEFYQMVNRFLNSHGSSGPDTYPYEIAMVSYRMDLIRNGEEG